MTVWHTVYVYISCSVLNCVDVWQKRRKEFKLEKKNGKQTTKCE